MKLKDLIPLKSKITVYVPATVDVNKEIDNSAQVERVARLLSECFGGATASPVRGYWVAENGALVAEKTTMVFAFCDTAAAEKYIDDVVTLCNELKHEMGQAACTSSKEIVKQSGRRGLLPAGLGLQERS